MAVDPVRLEKLSMSMHYVINEHGEPVSVLLSINEYRALLAHAGAEDDTDYLLRSPENARRLQAAIEDAKLGRNLEAHELIPDD
jgi:PHD/YefM family antitoxin component YafN of YafNO toxin-antitoxin module